MDRLTESDLTLIDQAAAFMFQVAIDKSIIMPPYVRKQMSEYSEQVTEIIQKAT